MTIIFDGREFARGKTEELVRVVGDFRAVGKIVKLAAILAGDNPESELYLRLKEKKAKEIGIEFEWGKFDGKDPQKIIDFIEEKNKDPRVNGIIVELPLPKELRIANCELRILNAIDPRKDVDCLTSENLKLLKEGKPKFVPPTVRAVVEILEYQVLSIKYQEHKEKIVVVGSEGTVGKGILSYLREIGLPATPSQARLAWRAGEIRGIDKETTDLSSVTKEADILISATGVGHLIKKEMVKPGAVVIDVGIEKQLDGSLKGDVDFENVKNIASFITPVPGGVGPVTVSCLMENLLESVYH